MLSRAASSEAWRARRSAALRRLPKPATPRPTQAEGDGAEQCGAKRGEASAAQSGSRGAAEAAEAVADARDGGGGAEPCGAERGEAKWRRKTTEVAEIAEAEADARGEGDGLGGARRS